MSAAASRARAACTTLACRVGPLVAMASLVACETSSSPGLPQTAPYVAPPFATVNDAGVEDAALALTPGDFLDSIVNDPPCVLTCAAGCPEANAPWRCPALAAWDAIPHAATCAWDGGSVPAATIGKCVASDPLGDALTPVTRTAPVVLPDGRRLAPAGNEWVFDEADLTGGFPASSLLVPGTKWLVVADTGDGVESLRVVDTAKLRAGTEGPVASYVRLASPSGTTYGLAWRASTSTLYAGGGPSDPRILAYHLDTTTGALAADTTKTLALPPSAVSHAIALSADGTTLLAGQIKDTHVLVFATDTPAAAPKTIDLGHPDPFTLRFDPNDPTGKTAWATMWTMQNPGATDVMDVVRIDTGALTSHAIAVGKAPEEIAFLSARWAVVSNALGDSLTTIDLAGESVAATLSLTDIHGFEPTALAWDATNARLYATLASRNAVAAFDVNLAATPPSLTPAGEFPTAWWPTSVTVDPADGALYVTNGKGHGTTDDEVPTTFDTGGDITEHLTGSVQVVPRMTGAELAASEAVVDTENAVAKIAGYPTVACNGAPYDFPIPNAIADGASKQITHVVFVVRENKTFDALFGDMAGADGDPAFVLAPGHMDELFPNARALAKTFAHMTNFYEDAELSVQGHTWTAFGRSTDYDERRWPLAGGGRAVLGVFASAGVGAETQPIEGSIFTSVLNAGLTMENGGEFVGNVRDFAWPGGTPQTTTPDTLPACWLAAHARSSCDLAQFTYAWLPNDHTNGVAPNWPNPAVMIATNDEATGMLVDGLSHSPYWPSTLVIVVEDDPQDGSDHVDHHRSIALFASPWVKRGYASRGHYGMSSLHKLMAHVLGTPYRNKEIEEAPLPLDLFTGSPDYTPFTYAPRKWTNVACNAPGTLEAMRASRWDFSMPDEQPGLSTQVEKYMRSLDR